MQTTEKILRLIKNGDFEEAAKQIKQLKSYGMPEDVLELAEELSQLGFIEQAKELYEHLLLQYPEEGELLVSLAELLLENDQEDEAMLLLEQVDQEDDAYPAALLLQADLYQIQGMDEVSEQKLLQAKRVMPEETVIDFALGELYYNQGRYKEALNYYMKLVTSQTDFMGININQRMAEALSGSGSFEEALPYFDKALSERMEINTLFEYGFTAFQAGHYKTAVNKFNELKDIDPQYNSLYLYLAKAYEHLEELDQALDSAKEGIRSDEFNKELYFYAGKISLKLGLKKEAESHFREALAIDPGYLEATITLLKFLVHEERYEDVLETIDSVKQYGEDDPQFDWLSAVSNQKIEEYKEALKYYRKAYTYFNNNTDFLEDYGFFLIEEGDRETAGEIFIKLLNEHPTNDEYSMILERLKGEE